MIKAFMAGTAGLALAIPVAGPALGSSGSSDEVKTAGTCSLSSEWELKAEQDDDGVKVEFEVDSRSSGQVWDYVISGPAGTIASGTATTDDDGEFEVEAVTAGLVTDAFTAIATSTEETCDSSVGIGVDGDGEDSDDDSDDADDADDDAYRDDDDTDEGTCSDDSSIVLKVKDAGQIRVATLSVDGAKAGQKWRYKIKRGNKMVNKGATKTKGKKGTFKVKIRTKAKGALSADAYRTDGAENCTTDD